MFIQREGQKSYQATINDILFVCENVEDGYEAQAGRIADCYKGSLPRIAEFIIEYIISSYGDLNREELIQALGKPCVNLDMGVIFYYHHTFPEEQGERHTLEIEFSGDLENLIYFSIEKVEKKEEPPAVKRYEVNEEYKEYLKKIEEYRDYKAGMYKTMTLKEKIEFWNDVNTEQIPIFDEQGNTSLDTYNDYFDIGEEFLNKPEMFSLEDILVFMEQLDDWYYQPSTMDTIVNIIGNIACLKGKEGVAFLLTNLKNVPLKGRQYGLTEVLTWLMYKAYPLLLEAVVSIGPSDRALILHILEGEEKPSDGEKKGEIMYLPEIKSDTNGDLNQLRAELETIILKLNKAK